FAQNENAGLVRIDYNAGNRRPVIENFSVDQTSGTLPLDIVATVDASDPEQDQLRYIWNLGEGATIETDEPRLEHTFSDIGDYPVSVEVDDGHGHSVSSQPISVYAGNEAPGVRIEIEGNSTFYFPGQPVSYAIHIEDNDDPSASEDLSSLFVSADYVESDETGAP